MTTRKRGSIRIFKLTQYGEIPLGRLEKQNIYSTENPDQPCAYIDSNRHLFRVTNSGEHELGHFTESGEIFSNGLFQGGSLGWLDDDGVVVQAGFILGEEAVGRVERMDDNAGQKATDSKLDNLKPDEAMRAAAAALLLYFLPRDAEDEKRMTRF